VSGRVYIHARTYMHTCTHAGRYDDALCDEAVGQKRKKNELERAFMGALKYSLSENGRLLKKCMYVCIAPAGASSLSFSLSLSLSLSLERSEI